MTNPIERKRRNYRPPKPLSAQLQQQIDELQKVKAALVEKTDSLVLALKDLDVARQRAEENERELRVLFEGISDGVAVVDRETREFRRVNPAFCKMLGYTEAELLQLTISAIRPPEDLPRLLEEIDKWDYGTSVLVKNLLFKCKDGTLFYTDVNGAALDFEDRPCVIGVCRDITERKRAEEQLKERDEWMRYIIQHDPNAITILDNDLRHIFVSDRFLQDYGLTERDAVGRSFYDVVPEMPEKWKAVHQRCLAGAVEKNDDDFFVRPDGSITYNRWECRPWFRANGEIGGIIIYTEVITERKKAEEALRKSEEHLRRFIEGIPVGYAQWKMDGSVVDANDHLLQMLGYSREDLQAGHLNWMKMTPEEFRLLDQQAVDDLLATGRCFPFEKAFVSKQGNRVPVLLSAVAVDEARQEGGAFVLDLTEHKRAEEAKVRSEQKYRELVENANSIILRWTPDGIITYLNEFGLTFFGYSEDEILGRRAIGTIVPETESTGRNLFPLMSEIRANPKQFEHNINENMRRNGERVWIDWTNKAVFDDEGRIKEILSIGSDVTERLQAEEALAKAKEAAELANHAKDRFIAALSHELRTPLTPLLAVTTTLETHKELPAHVLADLEVIRRNVDLETKLIDDLLDVTRISRGQVQLHQEIVDAHACLRATLEVCQSEIKDKRLKVSLNYEAAQHHVWADPGRLQQVFWKLLSNAVKFTPEEGQISIRTANIDGRLRMEFSDTGIGIDPELKPRIFNAFEQGEQTRVRRFGGLGLGLSIAKAVMDLHHGTIAVFSKGKDKGATFTLELSAIPPVNEPSVPPSATALRGKGSKKILRVEDNADTLRILSRLLRKWGYHVLTADCVKAAMERAAKEPFDLLVSDLGLPDGSGLDIMQSVKELYGVRGLAISGFGTDEDIRQSQAAGFEDHLVKPVSFQVLQNAIEQIASPKKQ